MLRKRDKAAGRQRLLLRLGSFECFLVDDWNGALRFRRHAFSGSLGTLGVEWLCLSRRCPDVAHRHVRMCYGYVLGYALAVEVQNPFTVSLNLVTLCASSISWSSRCAFILCFWFEAFVARLEASQTFPANCVAIGIPSRRALMYF